MKTKVLSLTKWLVLAIFLFFLFWFINSGFFSQPFWLPLQAFFFMLVTLVMMFVRAPVSIWFLVIAAFFLLSALLEIFNLAVLSEIAGSTGFGILALVVIWQLTKVLRGKKERV